METTQNRASIPFTNEHLVTFLKKLQALGSPYWYGTCIYKCKQSMLESKTKQYPSHYTSSRKSRYEADVTAKRISSDCIGAIKGYMWTNGGEGVLEAFGTDKTFTNKYKSNNCPDKSANGMFSYAKELGMDWGTIDTMPNIVGLAVCYDGHVGVHVGDGLVVEWRGFQYGSQITRLKDRKWKHWYKLPFIDYRETAEIEPVETALGGRLLKLTEPLIKGSDVEMLQELLMQIGYVLPEYGADGEYGQETVEAVEAFQHTEGLEVDGKYGPLTHAALMDAVADHDASLPSVEESDQTESPAAPGAKMVEIVSKGGNVNVRNGNGSEYARISSVKPGTRFAYVATAVNGWNAIAINGSVGWVSGDYSKIVEITPEPKKVKAIPDISRWQKDINFEAMAPEVEFVIARGMYETGKDVYIDRYASEMTRLGIPFGVYQYSIATTVEEARAEARAFYEAMKGFKPLFYVLDAESDGLDAALIGVWAEEMRKLGAKKLGCYVAHNHYDDYEYDTVRDEFDFTWIPRYGSNDGTVEGSKRPAYNCDLWQYTSKGTLAGVKGDIDLNLLSGAKTAEWFRGE
jgi:GH25 family lysozyme M1 (1,4-beta-N-acetylmuramidase)